MKPHITLGRGKENGTMKNFRLFIVDDNGERIFATKSFRTKKQFSKWFAKNVFMFNTKLNFVLGLTPIEIR